MSRITMLLRHSQLRMAMFLMLLLVFVWRLSMTPQPYVDQEQLAQLKTHSSQRHVSP